MHKCWVVCNCVATQVLHIRRKFVKHLFIALRAFFPRVYIPLNHHWEKASQFPGSQSREYLERPKFRVTVYDFVDQLGINSTSRLP